jgi:hypothetical protein
MEERGECFSKLPRGKFSARKLENETWGRCAELK